MPFHQPPQPPESGAGRTWAEKYEERRQQWCFQPVKNLPPPPVKDPSWSRQPLDQFILAKLEAAHLPPSRQAAPAVLTRRLSFALTGLPPSPALNALPFEAQVERLLASPAFGEHWARHWMDVVRYAETHGSEHDYLTPYAWRYRDYLVRAFNEDLPYDRFVQEQIAGDLLETPRMHAALGVNESLLATACQRMTEFYATPVDTMREQSTVLDWQIDTLGRAFLGLTLSCARCHDHKFDPISTADFYALYGVFTGARPVLNIVDDPALLTRHDEQLQALKNDIRQELAARWLQARIDAKDLKRAVDGAEGGSRLAQLRQHAAAQPPSQAPVSPLTEVLPLDKWAHSGPGLPQKVLPAGALSLHGGGDAVVRAIYPGGYFSDAVTDRYGGSLRSPEFQLTRKYISVLSCGTNQARLRLVVDGCQGDIVLFSTSNRRLDSAAPGWVTMRLREQWLGRRAHLELMTTDDVPTVGTVKDVARWMKIGGPSSFGIMDVVVHDDGVKLTPPPLPEDARKPDGKHWDLYVADLNHQLRDAIAAWRQDRLTDEQASLLQMLLDAGLLPNQPAAGTRLAALVKQFRALESSLPRPRRAPGVRDDRSAHDSPVFVRGDYQTPGEVVPRRMPDVLGGRPLTKDVRGDRHALAMELTRRDNPLVARVMVNRVWHHLFGRGLVGSTDNFGRMGDKPTHPELLDHLATKFMEDGWSVKRLIRHIVTSAAWRTSSEPGVEALKKDPSNLLLSHAHIRRLEAESIRDSLLQVAGNADTAMEGPSLHSHYRTAVDPDKQPPSGPLDGRGRRSLYLEVRRNFLSDFMITFDFPRPSIPTGSRSVTNVPAQSIALMNDPFVQHQAAVWAARVEARPGSLEERVTMMYQEAFNRDPSADELARALDFVQARSAVPVAKADHPAPPVPSPWLDLAHAIFNMKEFIYLP